MVEFPLALLGPTPDALRRLVGLRYAVAALLAVAVLGVRFIVGISPPLGAVAAGLTALLLVNCVVHWQIATGRAVSEQELFANFTAEVLALTSLLYFAGGSTSPLVSLYLLPLTVAANLLTRRHVWILTVITVLCYSLLLQWYVPFEPQEQHGDPHSAHFGMHVLGMWVIFIVS